MAKKFYVEARFLVFAHVYVDAADEQAARDLVAKGGSSLDGCIDYQTHTVELDHLANIEMVRDYDADQGES